MTDKNEHIVDWLRDAHAMEQQSEQMLEGELKRIEHYPELKRQVAQHLEDSREQRQLLEGCLNRLGAKPSTAKDLTARAVAVGQSLSGIVFSDEVMKGAMSWYVFENMEIISYEILIAAAEAIGDDETKSVCERILQQEVAMAEWLRGHVPQLTQAFLGRSEGEAGTAKR